MAATPAPDVVAAPAATPAPDVDATSTLVLREQYNKQAIIDARNCGLLSADEKAKLKPIVNIPVCPCLEVEYNPCSKYGPLSAFCVTPTRAWPAARLHPDVVRAALFGAHVARFSPEQRLCELASLPRVGKHPPLTFPNGLPNVAQATAIFRLAGVGFSVTRDILGKPDDSGTPPYTRLRDPVTFVVADTESWIDVVVAICDNVAQHMKITVPPIKGKQKRYQYILEMATWRLLRPAIDLLKAQNINTAYLGPDGLVLNGWPADGDEELRVILGHSLEKQTWPLPHAELGPPPAKKDKTEKVADVTTLIDEFVIDASDFVPACALGVLNAELSFDEFYNGAQVVHMLSWSRCPHADRNALLKLTEDKNSFSKCPNYKHEDMRHVAWVRPDGTRGFSDHRAWLHNSQRDAAELLGVDALPVRGRSGEETNETQGEKTEEEDSKLGSAVQGVSTESWGYATMSPWMRRLLVPRDFRVIKSPNLAAIIAYAAVLEANAKKTELSYSDHRLTVTRAIVRFINSTSTPHDCKVVCPIPEGLLIRGVPPEDDIALLAGCKTVALKALGLEDDVSLEDRLPLRFYSERLHPIDTDPSPYRGIGAVFQEDRLVHENDLLNWQRFLHELLPTPPNGRTIHLFWEAEGNAGKSSLVRFLDFHHRIAVCDGAKVADMARIVGKAFLVHQGVLDAVIIDMPRIKNDVEKVTHVFGFLENLLNGSFSDPKYDSTQRLCNPPHVIVFSNWTPADEQRLLIASADRWHVYQITERPPNNNKPHTFPNAHLLHTPSPNAAPAPPYPIFEKSAKRRADNRDDTQAVLNKELKALQEAIVAVANGCNDPRCHSLATEVCAFAQKTNPDRLALLEQHVRDAREKLEQVQEIAALEPLAKRPAIEAPPPMLPPTVTQRIALIKEGKMAPPASREADPPVWTHFQKYPRELPKQ